MRHPIISLAAATLLAAAAPAHAITFTYAWVGTGSTGGGSAGSGSLSFSANVADAANFSGLTLGNLTSVTYTWTNASTSRTINFSGASVGTLYANNTIAAISGVLSNPVVISDFPYNSFALTIAPSTSSAVGVSENASVGAFVDRDQGAWRLVTAVPEPATWALMLVGAAGVLARARHSRRA